ncbi:MAG: HAD-IA family hydrolase [Clostridia bacterium]|nr:HAD-IA family hydrolase [Clostridia bacterium]
MVECVIFDLDGTLSRSGEGIKNSVKYALEKFGIYTNDDQLLSQMIGPPLIDGFVRYFGLTEQQAKQAVGFYRETYKVKGLYECDTYDGVVRMLSTLKNKGKKIYIATSKPYDYTLKVLKHLKIYEYFDSVEGAQMTTSTYDKKDIINLCIKSNDCPLESIVMVGDRKFDIQGAKDCNIRSVGVTYGYGDRSELLEYGADYIVDTVSQLEKLLLEI